MRSPARIRRASSASPSPRPKATSTRPKTSSSKPRANSSSDSPHHRSDRPRKHSSSKPTASRGTPGKASSTTSPPTSKPFRRTSKKSSRASLIRSNEPVVKPRASRFLPELRSAITQQNVLADKGASQLLYDIAANLGVLKDEIPDTATLLAQVADEAAKNNVSIREQLKKEPRRPDQEPGDAAPARRSQAR